MVTLQQVQEVTRRQNDLKDAVDVLNYDRDDERYVEFIRLAASRGETEAIVWVQNQAGEEKTTPNERVLRDLALAGFSVDRAPRSLHGSQRLVPAVTVTWPVLPGEVPF